MNQLDTGKCCRLTPIPAPAFAEACNTRGESARRQCIDIIQSPTDADFNHPRRLVEAATASIDRTDDRRSASRDIATTAGLLGPTARGAANARATSAHPTHAKAGRAAHHIFFHPIPNIGSEFDRPIGRRIARQGWSRTTATVSIALPIFPPASRAVFRRGQHDHAIDDDEGENRRVAFPRSA